MSATRIEAVSLTEALDQLDELAACVKRLTGLANTLGWELHQQWIETGDRPTLTLPSGLDAIVEAAAWEVLHGIGWGESGPANDYDRIDEYADCMVEVVALARRRMTAGGAS